MKILFVGVFGLLGIYLRYFIDTYYSQAGQVLPIATFINNTLGCLLAGIIYAFVVNKGQSALYVGLLSGLCGGLTTFSGFNLQILNLINQGFYSKSVWFLIIGPSVGMTLILLGYGVTNKLLNTGIN
jgi:CrcB protein